MRSIFYIIVVILSVFSLLALPVAVSGCGDNGVYMGAFAGGDCDGESEGMSIAHLSGMMDIFLIAVTINILLVVGWQRLIRLLSVFDIISPSLFKTLKLGQQGITSLFYLMKPHDRLLSILTKIYKKHFALA